MLRFIIALIFVIIFLIVSILPIIILFFIGLFAPKARAKASQFIVTGAFRVVTFISGAKIDYKGLENVPTDIPVLYIPNHRSIFDIIITYPKCPRQTAFIAKKETGKIPIFNIWMAFMNCQFLDRKDLRKGLKMILKSVDFINDGISVCIFPEGTRNKGTEDLLPFHDGSLKIAEKSHCAVVPIAITNSESIFEAQFPKLRPAKVTVEYLPPIYTDGYTREDFRALSKNIQEQLREAYRKNK